MAKRKNIELKVIYVVILLIFFAFLIVPFFRLLNQAFFGGGSFTLQYFKEVLQGAGFADALKNSLLVSVFSALITTVLAFLLAYTIYYTNVPGFWKKLIHGVASLPMLLPTIT